jgi:8-oxo-dGTP pyrophosphatase MutT (NUDIX family)
VADSGRVAREISAGGLVVRRMRGRAWLAVIEPQGRAGMVALPKGIVDRGEEPAGTAVREVREETGVDARLVEQLPTIRYVYQRGGMRIFKVVSFFLLRYRGGRIGEIPPAMAREVARAWWIPLEEAPRRLSYRGEREVAAAAADRVAAAAADRITAGL